MTIIKAETKKGQSMIERANNCEGYSLHDVYGSFSRAKENAWEYCLNLCHKENGYNFHIISFNTFGFSVAWNTAEGVRIETPQNSYIIK